MIGKYLLPALHPLWVTVHKICATYNVTPLAFHILQTLTFLSALVFMATQMLAAGAISFILHFIAIAVYRISAQVKPPSPILRTLHVVGLSSVTVFALAFGLTGNFGMPIAFLFLSWIILTLSNLAHPSVFQLVGLFEIGLSVAVMGLAATYIPAIAILFGLTCLVSAGITLMMGTKVET